MENIYIHSFWSNRTILISAPSVTSSDTSNPVQYKEQQTLDFLSFFLPFFLSPSLSPRFAKPARVAHYIQSLALPPTSTSNNTTRRPKMEAPLSSPSLQRPPQTQPSYFTPSTASTSSTSSSSSAQPSSYSASQPAPQQYQPAQIQQQQQAQAQQQQAGGTSPFLRDFNLVAEAAKRAQMAVLMRDMEAVGI